MIENKRLHTFVTDALQSSSEALTADVKEAKAGKLCVSRRSDFNGSCVQTSNAQVDVCCACHVNIMSYLHILNEGYISIHTYMCYLPSRGGLGGKGKRDRRDAGAVKR